MPSPTLLTVTTFGTTPADFILSKISTAFVMSVSDAPATKIIWLS